MTRLIDVKNELDGSGFDQQATLVDHAPFGASFTPRSTGSFDISEIEIEEEVEA